MNFPELFQDWYEWIDFLREPNEDFPFENLWKGLRESEEENAWTFIEENYLEKYRMFVRVFPDYGSSGVWENPYPGNGAVLNIDPEETLGLPLEVCELLKEYQDYFDKNSPRDPSNEWEEDPCDHDEWDAWGLRVAKEVKRFTSPDVYIEFHQFRELVIINDEVVELDVPEFIKNLTRQNDL